MFLKMSLLKKHTNSLKNTKEMLYFYLKHIPNTGSTSQQPSPMIMHHCSYQTNTKKFDLLGAHFQFHISCTAKDHLETITITCKVNQVVLTSSI